MSATCTISYNDVTSTRQEQEFPGAHIGPEPTTDRFMAIMHGPAERVTPGNAVAVQADKPFRGLSQFGTAFLRFEPA